MRVTMFCGGRGAANVVRSLIADRGVDLTIVVNAYDNGRSTGRIRDFVPGMLGPSDVRKNLVSAIPDELADAAARRTLLEWRFSEAPAEATEEWLAFLAGRAKGPLADLLDAISAPLRNTCAKWVNHVAEYREERIAGGAGDFDAFDCCIGNIVFAGAYLAAGHSFNAATEVFLNAFSARANILNVTAGENLYLAGVRGSGAISFDEAEMVTADVADPVVRSFLLAGEPDEETRDGIQASSPAERLIWAGAQSVCPAANPRVLEVIRRSDVIVYAAGTPSSSLWPSYLTQGIGDTIAANVRAKKLFVMNLRPDVDVRGLSGDDLVRLALEHLGAGDVWQDHITHIVVSRGTHPALHVDDDEWRPSLIVNGAFDDPVVPGTHRGAALAGLIDTIGAQRHLYG